MTQRFKPLSGAVIAAVIALTTGMSVSSATLAQTQEQTERPVLNRQAVQQIDPRLLELADQNRQILQSIDTRLQSSAVNIQEVERDEYGRPLAPINWGEVRESLSEQNRFAVSDATALQTQVQSPPLPRNVETAELMRPRLPILMPSLGGAKTRSLRSGGGEDGMLIFPRDNFYSATMHINGLMIEVSGTRVMTGEMTDPLMLRRTRSMRNSEGAIVTEHETGVELSFTRFGAAYNILITCEDPEANPDCQDPETARAVYSRLSIMGGSPDGLNGEIPQ